MARISREFSVGRTSTKFLCNVKWLTRQLSTNVEVGGNYNLLHFYFIITRHRYDVSPPSYFPNEAFDLRDPLRFINFHPHLNQCLDLGSFLVSLLT